MGKLKAQDLRIGNLIEAYIEPQVSETIELDSVHRLQNLFYEVKRKELTLKTE